MLPEDPLMEVASTLAEIGREEGFLNCHPTQSEDWVSADIRIDLKEYVKGKIGNLVTKYSLVMDITDVPFPQIYGKNFVYYTTIVVKKKVSP